MKRLNGTLDVDDLAKTSTRERLDYMVQLGVNDKRIIGRLDFDFSCTVHVNGDGRWFLTETSNILYEIDPTSLKKVTAAVNIIARRHFNPGEYIVRTDDERLFQGRNEVLQHELDPLTLRDKVDEFFHPSLLVGFRDRRYSMNGHGRKPFVTVNNAMILRSVDDVYAAMIDIADGNADAGDYSATNSTIQLMDGTIKLMGKLKYIQEVRELYGKDYALKRAMDYIIKNMDVDTSSFDGNGKKGGLFNHKDLMSRRDASTRVISPDGVSYPQYGGEIPLVIGGLVGRLLVSTSMLEAISIFSGRGNRQYI